MSDNWEIIKILLDFVVQITSPAMTTVITILAVWGVKKLTCKWDGERQAALLKLTEGIVRDGLAFAEEQSRKALRAGDTQPSKLRTAMDFVHRRLDQSGLPGMLESDLAEAIEARLQQERSKPDGVVPGDS